MASVLKEAVSSLASEAAVGSEHLGMRRPGARHGPWTHEARVGAEPKAVHCALIQNLGLIHDDTIHMSAIPNPVMVFLEACLFLQFLIIDIVPW